MVTKESTVTVLHNGSQNQAGVKKVHFYLNAFLGPLSAMHHGSEGERGDETAQEVLNAHAQDSHTCGNEHTVNQNQAKHARENLQWVIVKKASLSHCCLLCYTPPILFYEVKAERRRSCKCWAAEVPPLLSPTTTTTTTSTPPCPQNTCSVSSEGKWHSSVSGETQRNHRACCLCSR